MESEVNQSIDYSKLLAFLKLVLGDLSKIINPGKNRLDDAEEEVNNGINLIDVYMASLILSPKQILELRDMRLKFIKEKVRICS
jgi:hypothetical protein